MRRRRTNASAVRTAGGVILGFFVLSVAWAAPTLCNAASAPVVIDTRFELTAPDGRKVTERAFRGKWLLVYFGYTFCPDVCPTTLSQIAATLKELGPRGDEFQPVFITLDPARDSAKVMVQYLKAFGPRFVGLRGTGLETAEVAEGFHAYYRLRSVEGGGYAVDHSSYIYVINPEGRFVELLTGDLPGHSLTSALRKLVG